MAFLNKALSLLLAGVSVTFSPQIFAQDASGGGDWNRFCPFGGSSEWTTGCNWAAGAIPAKSAAAGVRINDSSGESVMNENWQLFGIEIQRSELGPLFPNSDGNLRLRSSNGSVLTLHRGVRYDYNCPNNDCNGTSSNVVEVHIPIRIASQVNDIFLINETDKSIKFFGSIDTNGKVLKLRNEGPFNGSIELFSSVFGTGSLVKEGSGTAILRGVNTYTGSTTINSGILQIRSGGLIPDSSSVFVNNSIFRIIGQTDAINGLNGNGRTIIDPNSHLVIGNYPGFNSIGSGDYSGQLDLLSAGSRISKRGPGTQIFRGVINNNSPFSNNITAEEGLLWFTSSATFAQKPSFQLLRTGDIRFDSVNNFETILIDTRNQTDLLNGFTIDSLIFGDSSDAFYRQTSGTSETERLNLGANAYATYFQTGGQNTVNDVLMLGVGEEGVGEYLISAGNLSVTERIEVGYNGEGLFNIDGTGSVDVSELRVGGREILNSTGFAMFELNNGELTTDETLIGKGGSGGFSQTGGVHKAFSVAVGSDNPAQGAGSGFYVMNGGALEAGQILILQKGEFDLNGGEVRISEPTGYLATGGGPFRFNGGTLSTPQVLGSLVNSGGTLSPGNSPGTTVITGDYIQTTGEILIEIAGTGASEIDFIDVRGDVDLRGGKVIFSFIDDFLPNRGLQFDFISAGDNLTIADALAYEFIGLREDFRFQVDQIGTSLRFLALINGSAPVPIPASFWLFGSALLALSNRQWFFSKAKQAQYSG